MGEQGEFEKYMAENKMNREELSANIKSLKKQTNDSKAEILTLTQSLEDVTKLNADATEQINKLNAQMGISESERLEHQQTIELQSEEIKKLTDLFQDEIVKEMDVLTQSKFAELNQKINEQYLQQHELKLDTLKQQMSKLNVSLKTKEKKMAQEVNAFTDSLKNEMENLKTQLKAAQESGGGKDTELEAKYSAMEIELSSIQNKNAKLEKSINILKKKAERFQKQVKKLKDEKKKKTNAKANNDDENENEQPHLRRSSRKKQRTAFKALDDNKSPKKASSDEDSDVKPTHRYMLRSSSKKRKRSREMVDRDNQSRGATALRNKIRKNQEDKTKQNLDKLLLNSVEPTKKRRKMTNS